MLILTIFTALAISGGVDSMALAYLCSRSVRASSLRATIADNPVSHFRCYIVDHRLREGSTAEAHAVVEVLKSMGLRSQHSTLNWSHIIDETGVAHPKDLPNLETLARRMRYQRLADHLVVGHIASLLVAHHQDDQYETVLMRLLSGHGKAGLMGMRPATDIPECYDVHGAWKSGFVDDQMLPNPVINYRPSRKELAAARRHMREEMDPELIRRELQAGTGPGTMGETDFDAYVPKTKWLLPAAPPAVEDGGVMVYRPLLEFSKDRLIATCEAAKIPWFEDATNTDPTLTTRNAVRYLVKNYTLPVALQKPAILEMSARLNRQNALDEAETMRLLARTVIRDFEPTVGTVVVQLPSFRIPRLRKGHNEAKNRKRLEHYRKIAALLVKKVIAIVTPEIQSSFATNLQNTVFRLFPSLHDKPSAHLADPKSFNVSSVHFIPIREPKHPNEPLKWYLTREPYVSDRPLPLRDWACLPLRQRWRRRPEQWRWPERKIWRMWDGRFWVHILNRTSVHVAVAPFEMKYAKAFRDSLPDGRARDELMALMKLHAPGKVRYTLPAIYTAGDHLEAIRNYEERADREKIKMREREIGIETEWVAAAGDEKDAFQKALEEERDIGLAKPLGLHWSKWMKNWKLGNQKEQVDKVLVALPTLGIAKPGLNNWLRYELRYRRVDKRVLEKSLADGKELTALEKARAKARARGLERWFQRFSSHRRRSFRGSPRRATRLRQKVKV